MDPASFLEGHSRETTIFRDAWGRWFHDGEPLEHPNLVEAFDRWLERAEDGRYCLKNDINWAYITIEGPPHFVRSARVEGADVIVSLSNGTEEALVAKTLRQGQDGALYCDVIGGELPARFERHAMSQLESIIAEDDQGVYLDLGGERIRPPVMDDPLAGN